MLRECFEMINETTDEWGIGAQAQSNEVNAADFDALVDVVSTVRQVK